MAGSASADSSPRLRLVASADLAPAQWAALTELCALAFGEPWDGYWAAIGPGIHVLAEDAAGIIGHAAVVERRLHLGHRILRCGYVEAVAVRPDRQRHGIGQALMTEVNVLLDDSYEIGALSTGSGAFYARLGWVPWTGPAFVRHADGRLRRTADEDGGIMVRRTPATPSGLPLDGPIAVDWRPGEVW